MFCEYFAYIYLWLVSNGDIGCYITDLAHLGEEKIKKVEKRKRKGKGVSRKPKVGGVLKKREREKHLLENQEGLLTGMFLMSPISTSLASLLARASSFAALPHLKVSTFTFICRTA